MVEVTICEIRLEDGRECGMEFRTDWEWREHYVADHPDDTTADPEELRP